MRFVPAVGRRHPLRAAARRAAPLWAPALLLGCAEPSPLHGANVVLVVADALRADRLGCYGYPRPTSPFIDSLARRGVLFEQVLSPSSQTVPSVLSLWSAVYPHRHGNQYFPRTDSVRAAREGVRPRVPEALPLLAELFSDAGYRAHAVVTNPWLQPRFGFDRGFEGYHFLPGGPAFGPGGPGDLPESGESGGREADGRDPRAPVRGEAVNAKARALLRELRGERFLLYLHYMDVHHPYDPPLRHRRRFLRTETEGLHYVHRNGPSPDAAPSDVLLASSLYDAEVRGFDALMRDLHGALAEAGVADSTLLVITSDHGDEFHEHGGLGHGWTLFQEVVHPPLVFSHPALGARPRRVDAPVSLVDVLPTLLELVGAAVPPDVDGHSWAARVLGSDAPAGEAAAPSRILLAELGDAKAARRGPAKLVSSGRGPAQAFDLRDDPGERQPLREAVAWREALAAALERARRHDATRAAAAPGPGPGAAPDAAAEELFEQQLRALGYAD